MIFVAAVFGRTRFKYGVRGYRFALLEAGHVGQNVLLAATALGLGAVPLGGYYDRLTDEFLGLDGVNESTLYIDRASERARVTELGVGVGPAGRRSSSCSPAAGSRAAALAGASSERSRCAGSGWSVAPPARSWSGDG